MLAFPKPPSRAQDKRERSKAKLKAWLAIRKAVLARDGHRCRCCGARDQVDVHHRQFRSRGGADTPANLLALCREHHADLHAYRLTIVGDDANKTLRFVRER